MNLINRTLRLSLVGAAVAFFIIQTTSNPLAQTTVPARTSHVNDFAGVVDDRTRNRLETLLGNLEQRTGIQFDVATVQSTSGKDIFNYSRLLAREWNIGASTTRKKSLLLVISMEDKTSFTQFSRTIQKDLPEGVLGEMSQRMRVLLDSDQFNAGLNGAIEYFVTALGKKLAFTLEDVAPRDTVASVSDTPEAGKAPSLSQPTPAKGDYVAAGQETRRRKVTVTPVSATSDEKTAPAIEQPSAAVSVDRPSESVNADRTPESVNADRLPVSSKPVRVSSSRRAANVQKATTTEEDEDESEEVELTLTLPLAERIVALKEFLATHPNSKSRGRAQELLVSAHAALADQQLKNRDNTAGMENFRLAVEEAPVDVSEQLFAGVIAQIPLNLYLRNERIAAFKTAEEIESKFGNDPQRLLALANFYLGIERGDEAARLAAKAVSLAPDLAEAHYLLGLARHISLRLDEAAEEYKRAIELDGNFRAARRSLADLSRASGKAEEALAFYREQLSMDATDKVARAGLVLSLLELGQTEEGEKELAAALADDPKNVSLLVGAAYWFAAHNDSKRALEFAMKAVELEPRYTWSQIALARALVGEKRPLDAERALRYARMYGKFPTLDYELASVLSSAGLYDEAAELLTKSFTLKDGEIETRLGGRTPARSENFIDLLAPERRGSLFQFAPADTPSNAKILKALLSFTAFLNQATNGENVNEQELIATGKEFATGDDPMRVYRQLYVAGRLLRLTKNFEAIRELVEGAKSGVEAGLDTPAATVAVQADELRDIRARAIAGGNTPTIAEAPRNSLSNILRGRIEDLLGWLLFNEEKPAEAVDPLRRAVNILPEGTPAWRTATWHLGAALEQTGDHEGALNHYIKSYISGERDSVRRALIERLYVKVNGSTEGLDARIGPAVMVGNQSPVTEPGAVQPSSTNESESPATTLPEVTTATSPPPSPTESSSSTPTSIPADPTAPPVSPSDPNGNKPKTTPTDTLPTSPPAPTPSPEQTRRSSEPDVSDIPQKQPTSLKITGRVKDASGYGIANVVVVLISPRGSVLASTTDSEGNYSFTVSPSERPFRLLPSKEGISFEPLDKTLILTSDDQKDVDFVGIPTKSP